MEGSHDEAKSDGRRSDTGSAKGAFEVDGPFDWDVGGRDDGDGADNSGGAEAPGIEHGDMPSSAVQAKRQVVSVFISALLISYSCLDFYWIYSKRWAKWGRSKSQTGCQTSASTGSIAEDGETQTLSSSASRDLAVVCILVFSAFAPGASSFILCLIFLPLLPEVSLPSHPRYWRPLSILQLPFRCSAPSTFSTKRLGPRHMPLLRTSTLPNIPD